VDDPDSIEQDQKQEREECLFNGGNRRAYVIIFGRDAPIKGGIIKIYRSEDSPPTTKEKRKKKKKKKEIGENPLIL